MLFFADLSIPIRVHVNTIIIKAILLDIYMILLSGDVNMDEVYKILSYDKKTIGDSFDLLNEKEVLKNGYNSLKGIVNKPSFDDVYNKVVGFLKEEHIITISSEIADNHEM